MIDPVTAIAGATAAFNFMKKGVQVGRDLQDMGQQLQQWAGCMADIDQAEKMIEKPPWYKALGGGVQAQAMEVFLARKKAKQMRDELREIISHPSILGPSHWQEFLRIEAEIRKKKREHEFRRMEIKQAITEWVAGIVLFLVLVGGLFVFVWLMRTANG
jgi:Fe2+ transport system protein B